MVKITVDIPEEIIKFIEKKISEGLFSSKEEFIMHAVRLLAELYGIGGISILEKLITVFTEKKKPLRPSELSEEEAYILSLFRESTFLYPEEIWARVLEDSMIRGIKPLKKEIVFNTIEKLVEKGYLQKLKKDGETIIKILKRVER